MLKKVEPAKVNTLRLTDRSAAYINQMVDLKDQFPKLFQDLEFDTFAQLANYCIENYLYLMLSQVQKTDSFDHLDEVLNAAVANDQRIDNQELIIKRLRQVDLTTEKIWYAMVNFTLHFLRTDPDDWKSLGSIYKPTDEEWEVDQIFKEYLKRDIQQRQLKNKGSNL